MRHRPARAREYTETLRERGTIVADEGRTRQEFTRALGLPPLSVVSRRARDGFAYRPLRLSPAVLETVVVDRRPDLKAAEEEYEQRPFPKPGGPGRLP